jgi:hypothetical protein
MLSARGPELEPEGPEPNSVPLLGGGRACNCGHARARARASARAHIATDLRRLASHHSLLQPKSCHVTVTPRPFEGLLLRKAVRLRGWRVP